MYLLLKVYDVPQSVNSGRSKAAPHLSLSEDDVRRKGLNSVPDDLYNDSEASGVPGITEVTRDAPALASRNGAISLLSPLARDEYGCQRFLIAGRRSCLSRNGRQERRSSQLIGRFHRVRSLQTDQGSAAK
jgi:hypothetical protein